MFAGTKHKYVPDADEDNSAIKEIYRVIVRECGRVEA